jgi:hypothetical protein
MRRVHPGHTDQPLLILGPTFSGTFPSLSRQLTVDTVRPYQQGVRVFSGSANSEASVRWFQLYLAKVQGTLHQEGWNGALKFRTFFESDSLMTDRFLCYLQHEGYPLGQVAILSEDETAFGKAESPDQATPQKKPASRCLNTPSGGSEGTPVYLYYPRDIASLRTAYEQQSIFSAGKPQSGAPSSSLRGNLSEPASSEHDTVRTYGGQLTPLAQEAELFSTAKRSSSSSFAAAIPLISSSSVNFCAGRIPTAA